MFFVTIVAFLIVVILSRIPIEVAGGNPFEFLGGWSAPLFTLFVSLFLYATCKLEAARLMRQPIGTGSPGRVFFKYYLLSLFFLFIITAVIQWPRVLARIPILGQSDILSFLCAFAPFVVMVISVWLAQYAFTIDKTGCRWTRRGMLLQQLRWGLMPVIPPVIAFTLADFSRLLSLLKTALDANPLLSHFTSDNAGDSLFICRKALDGFEQLSIWGNQYPLIFITLLMLGIIATSPFIFRIYFNAGTLPPGPMRSQLEEIIKASGFSFRDILVLPTQGGNLPNAFVAGLFPRGRYLVATDALLKYLPPSSIIAVFGHEIGHTVHKHLWGLFLLVVGFSSFAIVAEMQFQINDPMVYTLVLFVTLLVYIFLIFSYVSRQFERQADLHGAFVVSTPREMQNALLTIADILGLDRKGHALLHYNIDSRVDYIERAAADPRLVRRHHLRAGIIFWTLALVAVFLAGWATILQKRAADHDMFRELFNRGYYAENRGNYIPAESYLRQALTIRQDDFHANYYLAKTLLCQPPDTARLADAVTYAGMAVKTAEHAPPEIQDAAKELLAKAKKRWADSQPPTHAVSPSPRY